MTNATTDVLSQNQDEVILLTDSTAAGIPRVPDTNTFLPDIWEHLISHYGIQSVLDIGTGAGWSTRWFVDKGIYTLGIEGTEPAIRFNRCRSNVFKHDYAEGPFVPACCFDLAWCAGFVQQIPEELIPNVMASFQSCKYVCLTFPDSRQTAYRHANSQPTGYWVRRMNEYGFDHDPRETLHLRSTATDKVQWGRRGLTFFVRRGDFH